MYLGIDWGHKKIGLAVAQDDPRVAMAHATIDNDRDVFTRLAQIIAASIILRNSGIFLYLPFLMMISLFTGYFVGLVSNLTYGILSKNLKLIEVEKSYS